MYRVLLVDDEALICQGLQRLLPWEEFGLVVAGVASDGRTALSMLERERFDIMLLDISMPHMSGLELLAEARRRSIGIHTIIVSAYNAFSYVREALTFGVENYLIKPVEREELSSTLTVLVNKIDQERARDTLYKLGKDTLMDNVVYRYATGRISESELAHHSELLHWNLARPFTALTLIKLYGPDGKAPPYKALSLVKQALARLPLEGAEIYPCLSPESALLLVLVSDEPLDSNRWHGLLEARLPELLPQDTQYFAVISAPTADPRETPACYRACGRLLAYEFILPRNRIILGGMEPQAAPAAPVDIAREYAALKKRLLAGERDAFAEELRATLRHLKHAPALTPWQIRGIVGQLLLFLFQEVDFARESNAPDGYGVYDLLELPTMDEICQKMLELADRFIFSQQKRRNTTRAIAANMIDYVQAHYAGEVSLKLLAQALHFHPAYLGQVFKAETGQMFSDYLCAYRIEKAKELVSDTDRKIGDIAAEVGIPNANYFSNTFKKLVGTYPSTYRMMVQGESDNG
ncbi:MAG TPA: response regulator [Clostridia bacterium]|nr:response regulator [Clostridia bacterium]